MVRHKRWWHFAQSILVGAFVVAAVGAAGQDSEFAKAYNKHWAAAEKAAGQMNFREALARYGDVVALLPFEPSSRYKLACCLVRLGETDRALAELKVAVECGWADADALDRDEDWRPLRRDERFAEMVNAAAACRDEKLLLYADDSVGRDRPAPLLVVLHGLGCGPRGEMPYWKPVADELGMVVVAPRSGTEFGPMLHGWQKAGAKNSSAADFFDMDSARERVDAAIEEADRLYTIDRGAVVLAGYSQGGGVVLQLIADRPTRIRGAVAVCSLCPPLEEANFRKVANESQIRVQVIAGEHDRLLDRSKSAAEVLQAAGIPTRFEVVADSGHEYPSDSADRLRRAVHFVLTGESPDK